MDNIGEFIVPVIIFLIVGISKIVEMVRSSKDKEFAKEIDAEEAERRRQVQEEIRRRILERTSGVGPGAPSGVGGQPEREYDPLLPDSMQRRPYTRLEPSSPLPPMAPVGGSYGDRGAPVTTTPPSTLRTPTYEAPVHAGRDFAAELRQQREAVLESRRKAEDARNQSSAKLAAAGLRPVRLSESQQSALDASRAYGIGRSTIFDLQMEVQRLLADPRAAQKAIILAEVLGSPVGLRSAKGAQQPLWQA